MIDVVPPAIVYTQVIPTSSETRCDFELTELDLLNILGVIPTSPICGETMTKLVPIAGEMHLEQYYLLHPTKLDTNAQYNLEILKKIITIVGVASVAPNDSDLIIYYDGAIAIIDPLRRDPVVIGSAFFGDADQIKGITDPEQLERFNMQKARQLLYAIAKSSYDFANLDGLAPDAITWFMANTRSDRLPSDLKYSDLDDQTLFDLAMIEWVYQNSPTARNLHDFSRLLRGGYEQQLDSNMRPAANSIARALTNILRNSNIAGLKMDQPSIQQLRNLFTRDLITHATSDGENGTNDKLAQANFDAAGALIDRLTSNAIEATFTSSGKQVIKLSNRTGAQLIKVDIPRGSTISNVFPVFSAGTGLVLTNPIYDGDTAYIILIADIPDLEGQASKLIITVNR